MKISDLLADFEDNINNFKDIETTKKHDFDKLLEVILSNFLIENKLYYIPENQEQVLLNYIKHFIDNNSHGNVINKIKELSNTNILTKNKKKMADIFNTYQPTPKVFYVYLDNNATYDSVQKLRKISYKNNIIHNFYTKQILFYEEIWNNSTMTVNGFKIPDITLDSLRIKPWVRYQDGSFLQLADEQYNHIYEIYHQFEP